MSCTAASTTRASANKSERVVRAPLCLLRRTMNVHSCCSGETSGRLLAFHCVATIAGTFSQHGPIHGRNAEVFAKCVCLAGAARKGSTRHASVGEGQAC